MNKNQQLTPPKFTIHQFVYFIGGVGTILDFQVDANTWKYAVEMEKGPEPVMGRIGSETTIFLHERDIHGIIS
ncbi:hypothetical protein QUB80_06890 [Chlorogloeopsis sp. ULAP01]|uniref:hypothetical protein n=1 Tax=Chlorogloeopsis sp. ULAP01 TaxID=3056483 RepID=UPI0025AA33AC|nr:hypothetical protein [Chlorogloeopsis sp. ULAP01]MDM9380427.1 hypothetical protein [Chlorogloeopsis sp. ULAP01]